MYFNSPTYGKVDLINIVKLITNYINKNPTEQYLIIIGSDSQTYYQTTTYTSVIVIHHVGNGGIYFYRNVKEKIMPIKQRLINETNKSLELALKLNKKLPIFKNTKMEIHCDLSSKENNKSNSVVKQIIGMLKGCGFKYKIKPDAYGASSVADKHSK